VGESDIPSGSVNERQLDCLRLVAQNYSSKEIARQLGISRFTVDQRLRIACQKLGANSRFEAARLVAAPLFDPGYERLAYQSPYIAEADDLQMMQTLSSSMGLVPDAERSYTENVALRDIQGLVPDVSNTTRRRHFVWPNPLSGRETNDLTALQRAVWILVLTIVSAVAFGAFASGLEAISRLT
jgi:DNA-binding CsgD family transcriptional regulator